MPEPVTSAFELDNLGVMEKAVGDGRGCGDVVEELIRRLGINMTKSGCLGSTSNSMVPLPNFRSFGTTGSALDRLCSA